jgi:signal transduction histidine kinase
VVAVLGGALLLAGGAPAAPREAGPALLTHIRDVRALSPEQAARGYPVRLQGTVTYLDEDWPSGLVVHDGTAGQFVLYAGPYLETHPRLDLHAGDRIEVEGHTVRGGFAPNVMPSLVRRLGKGSLPQPRRLPYTQLVTGRYDCEYVEIAGIGRRAWMNEPPADDLFLEVAVEGGMVRASLRDVKPGDVDRFLDARVRLRGNVGALFGQAGQLRGVSLLAGRTRDVQVDEAAPDPFTLPVRPLSSLFRYSAEGEVGRRIRVRGVVTGERTGAAVEVSDFTTNTKYRDVRHVLYVQDATGAARVETSQANGLRPGDLLDVAGFPVISPTRPRLNDAVHRRLGFAPPPAPAPLLAARPLVPERDGELVTAQALVLGVIAGPAEHTLVLQLGEAPFSAVLEAVPGTPGPAPLARASLVSVTGVYTYQAGPPPSFQVLLRSPADVVLISAGPWWTRRHTAVVAVIVFLVLAAAGLWIRMITNRHRLERAQDQAVLAERNRLARELHDTVEQGLAGITLQLEAVGGSLEASPAAARQALGVARDMAQYSMEEARRSVQDLRSQALQERDVAAALRDLAQRMTAGTTLRADVHVSGAPRPLPATVEHHLFRIGVEALTNAIRHSGARRVDIELRFGGADTLLVVRDDGSGFAPAPDALSGAHFGLRGIRERVDKLGGTLDLESQAGQGTRLAVCVPAAGGDAGVEQQ